MQPLKLNATTLRPVPVPGCSNALGIYPRGRVELDATHHDTIRFNSFVPAHPRHPPRSSWLCPMSGIVPESQAIPAKGTVLIIWNEMAYTYNYIVPHVTEVSAPGKPYGKAAVPRAAWIGMPEVVWLRVGDVESVVCAQLKFERYPNGPTSYGQDLTTGDMSAYYLRRALVHTL